MLMQTSKVLRKCQYQPIVIKRKLSYWCAILIRLHKQASLAPERIIGKSIESNRNECATTGNRTLDLRIGIPTLYYWAKESWAIYWQAHIHFIVNRGARMTPNILPVSNSSSIGWILLTARTKPTWCSHHFILSFRPPQTSFATRKYHDIGASKSHAM